MKTGTRKRSRRTRRDIEALLGRYHQSGKTAREFCRAEGVVESSLYRWLRQERSRTPTAALVEVKPATVAGHGFALVTPQGYRIEVPAGFSPEGLKRLLKVLEA